MIIAPEEAARLNSNPGNWQNRSLKQPERQAAEKQAVLGRYRERFGELRE